MGILGYLTAQDMASRSGDGVGDGQVMYESSLRIVHKAVGRPYISGVFERDDPGSGDPGVTLAETPGSGYLIAAYDETSRAALTVTIGGGRIVVDGQVVEVEAVTVPLTASQFNWIYVTPQETAGGDLTGITVAAVPTVAFHEVGAPPSAKSILIYCAETGLVGIDQLYDFRSYGPACVSGSYEGNDTARLINLGFRPKSVIIRSRSLPRIHSWSAFQFPFENGAGSPMGMAVMQYETDNVGLPVITDDIRVIPQPTAGGFTLDASSDYVVGGALPRTWKRYTHTEDFGTVPTSQTSSMTIVAPDLKIGDAVIAGISIALPNLVDMSWDPTATVDGSHVISFTNNTGANWVPGPFTSRITVDIDVSAGGSGSFGLNRAGEIYDFLAMS